MTSSSFLLEYKTRKSGDIQSLIAKRQYYVNCDHAEDPQNLHVISIEIKMDFMMMHHLHNKNYVE